VKLRLAVAAGLLALAAGCSAPDTTVAPAPTTSSTAAAAVSPAQVQIPAISASSTLTRVDLNADRTLQVPPVEQPEQAAWFGRSALPGQAGMPTIVVGHVNGAGRPGVFARLHDLAEGDDILVGRADGTTATFRVYRVDAFDKDAFPTDAVYQATDTPELRAITCGGQFEGGAHGYADNIVVFASYVGETS
jgi:hypothetical protein